MNTREIPVLIVLGIFWCICFAGIFFDGQNLLKSIYVPEVRMYEEFSGVKQVGQSDHLWGDISDQRRRTLQEI